MPGPGSCKISESPTPGTVKAGKSPAVGEGGRAQLELTDALRVDQLTESSLRASHFRVRVKFTKSLVSGITMEHYVSLHAPNEKYCESIYVQQIFIANAYE